MVLRWLANGLDVRLSKHSYASVNHIYQTNAQYVMRCDEMGFQNFQDEKKRKKKKTWNKPSDANAGNKFY